MSEFADLDEFVLAVRDARVAQMRAADARYPQILKELPERFPWSHRFREDEQLDFASELASIDPDDTELLETCVAQWKNSADILADPELTRILTEPVTKDFGPVLPPERED